METNIPAKVNKPRCVRTDITLPGGKLAVYAGKRVAHALKEVSEDLNLYKGVKLSEVIEAVYEQGKKDGSRGVFEQLDGLKKTIPHRNPGAPRKKPKQAKKKRK